MTIRQLMTNNTEIDTIRVYDGPRILEIKADPHTNDWVHVKLGKHQVAVPTKDLQRAIRSCTQILRLPPPRIVGGVVVRPGVTQHADDML